MIERLKEGDGLRLKKIRLKALKSDPDAFGTTLEKVLNFSVDVWNEQTITLPTFIAVHEDRDVGMVRVGVDGEDPSVCWLISLWVSSEVRGSGISVALIQALLKECESRGIEKVKLDVGDDNRAAIKLYEKMGFIRNGLTGYLPAPRTHITEFQMERKL